MDCIAEPNSRQPNLIHYRTKMSRRSINTLQSLLDQKWFPGLIVLILAGGLCSACGLGGLVSFRSTLYPGATLASSQGTTVTAQGGLRSGMLVLIARNAFLTGDASVSDISAWYLGHGWTPRFRANTSEGTTYIHTRTLRAGAMKVEWQSRVVILYDVSPPRLVVHTYLTISW